MSDAKICGSSRVRAAMSSSAPVALVLALWWHSSARSDPAAAPPQDLAGCLTPGGTLVNLALGGAPAHACSPQQTRVTLGGGGGASTSSFYVTIADGAERTVAAFGGHRVMVQCTDGGEFGVLVSLSVTSTDGEWYGGVEGQGGPPGGAHTANEVVLLSGDYIENGVARAHGAPGVGVVGGDASLWVTNFTAGARVFGRFCVVSGVVHTATHSP